MAGWLDRLLRRSPPREQAPLPDEGEESGPSEAPEWTRQLMELTQKLLRSQARLTLHVEGLDRKLEGGFEELRHSVRTVAAPGSAAGALRWDDLLDAMDLLEEATAAIDFAASPGAAEGLRGVLARLEGHLSQAALVRVGRPGVAPDGKVHRVVGFQEQPHLADGVIARVVRAAVLQGDRVIREGEVLLNRRSA